MRSAFQQLRRFTLQKWYSELENTAQSKPTWYLKCCRGQLSTRIPPYMKFFTRYLLEFWDKHNEQSINWGSTDSAPQLLTKHLLARLNPQPVHIVVMGMRWLNIYCCSAQDGQQNASVTLVIQLTSQICSRTMRWNSSSLRDICPPI